MPNSHSSSLKPDMLNPSAEDVPVLAPDHLQVRERRAGVDVRCRLKVPRSIGRRGHRRVHQREGGRRDEHGGGEDGDVATAADGRVRRRARAPVPLRPGPAVADGAPREVRCDEGVERHERREQRQQGRALDLVPARYAGTTHGRGHRAVSSAAAPPRPARVCQSRV